ncbi:2-oxoglutarate dehydrogenase E1 component [Enterobacteriaceae endosymbiont of Plateumaris braccata]|uniref:2-oxoglutarate dehydrogenase E1 component n=1 Tax=Enterobacteriaceae endosymbiont of Plateumaris braccata TaxID=2675793 RepID=UPI0014499D0B|nr:2-oxoglutarate dehydrogenase E1 component [Enterobacteriaceae endosymbiont of Plateumaris braccata]QJC28164.1 2-oxoglutarate dehydrogenase E1 component [Enterobacteriaceae endosymbiont of Plateumaris braccata]
MNNYDISSKINFLDINIFYIEKLYQKFLVNPFSIDKSWKNFFQTFTNNTNSDFINFLNKKNLNKNYIQNLYLIEKLNQLINNFRILGHYYSNINPLKKNEKKINHIFNLENYKFIKKNLNEKLKINNFPNKISIIDIYHFFKNVYCNSIGIEYMHIYENEKIWIQNKIEIIKKNFSHDEKKIFLEELMASLIFEKFISKKFPGSKRFSLEGCDVLIPILKEIIRYSSNNKNNITEIVLSMAHRGRLNVLTNIMGKKTEDIINEFNNIIINEYCSDDVKYHLGYDCNININNKIIKLKLAFNPSHLEIINSVIMGITRAKNDLSKEKNKNQKILPINIHGDSSITGQGVVQEILNMSNTRGYNVKGTIHIIINNQIGFTTSNIKDSRSSHYCSDIAKMIQSPIFHVNADNVEDVIFILRVAIDFRNKFNRDVFIDLVSYRRYGHNESDDPYITQPIMYNIIKKHPTIQELYSSKLIANKIIDKQYYLNLEKKYYNLLNNGDYLTKTFLNKKKKNKSINQNIINIDYLKKLLIKISTIPKNFNAHPRVIKIFSDRINMVNTKKIDWGAAENLAYAHILNYGISCRLTGQDVKRGTFSHRHAVIYDQLNGSSYCPLQNIKSDQGIFYIYNSVLSEEAVLGFEYGYSINHSNILTIWESQFGDFANGAQIVIDQFISSGEKKWNYKSNLILILPHGYDGQGPEHSSARIERYLQLSAENNMKICIPTNTSQIYHLLCKQAFNVNKKPLIIISPKALLRYNLAKSNLNDLVNKKFFSVIDENKIDIDILNVKRIIFCSGKIYYDLLNYKNNIKNNNIFIIRIEQLYPLPLKSLNKIFKKYKIINNFIWCQEEPRNQGAWNYIQYNFQKKFFCKINYIGRSESSSPATGHLSIHKQEQQKILYSAFNTNKIYNK